MPNVSSIAIRVYNLDSMVKFYSEAFHVQFQEVNTYGLRSQFGELGGVILKFVPIRERDDFAGYPVHQLGFTVPNVETVIDLALQYGGKQEGKVIRRDGNTQAAVRDPDGNTIELYSEE